MKVYEVQVSTIPAAVAINPSSKQIAFTKGAPSTFIDVLGELPRATWKDKCLEINGTEYQYNTWYSVADSEGDLHKYFKVLLQNYAVANNPFGVF